MTADWLAGLLGGDAARAAEPAADLSAYRARAEAALVGVSDTAARAACGGWLADRVGYAFAAGYGAALRALVPGEAGDRLACLCATEEGGAHPRAILTSLRADGEGYVVDGHKKWATLSTLADELLVVCSVGAGADGKNQLRLVRVPARAAGVTITAMPPSPFAPEIPHAQVALHGVRVDAGALLPGDGYDRYLKPFRTIEDAHVHAALLGHLLGLARRLDWPHELRERLAAALLTCAAVIARDPSPAATHVALAGLLAGTATLVDACTPLIDRTGGDLASRWSRDRPLLQVAARARDARREAAWRSLGTVLRFCDS